MAQNNDMDQLLAIRNQDEPDELTEEELQMAISADDQDDDEEYEDDDEDNDDGQVNDESTECEESFERNGKSDSKQSGGGGTSSGEASCKGVGPGGRPEYQFQMQDHHIFKGKHGKKLYKCDVCGAVYRHSFSLKRHFIRSHVNYGYLCETDVTNCGINLSASASLQAWNGKQYDDKQIHEFRDLFCCHSCVVFFDDLKGLIGHVDGSHRNNKSGTIEPVRIPCSQCNMSFIQRHNLMRHIEVVHQGKKLFTCKYCGRKFQSIADRKRHIKGLHPDELQSSPSHQVQITKTHQCSKCLLIFDSYSSLKKHVIKNHEESYHGCGFCNKFSFTKKQLNDHIKLKHGKTTTTKKQAIKKIGNNNTNESDGQSTSPSSSSFSSSINSSSYFHCSFCYRRFLTYGSLLRHKQVAHRSYQTTLKSQENTTTTTSPTRLRRTLSQVQVQNHNDNDNLMNQFSEIEFYQNIAQRIAENLLHFVDGKFVNCKSGQQDRVAQTRKVSNKIDIKKPEINLSKYNFPANFNISNEDQVQDDKIEFLSECNLQAKDELRNSDEEDNEVKDQMTDEAATKDLIYVCTACYCHVAPHLFAEHDVNNHPNVKCSFIEVDPKSIPYPLSLLSWDHHQQRLDGLLSKCPMIPILPKDSASSSSIKCTKCSSSFSSVDQLHQHILDCAFKNETAKPNETSTSTLSKTSNEILKTSETSTSKTNETSKNETSKNETSKTEVSTPKSIDQSPLSPCKTRSGKRRQTPEKLTPAKRSRDEIKNAKRELFSQEKINKKDGNNQHGNDGHDDHGKDGNNNCKRNTKGIIKQEITVQSVEIQEQINFEEIENSKLALLKPVLKDSKFYSCFKCHKKFLYMDQLKKHQFSICSRRFNNNKNNNKRLTRLRRGIKKKGLKVKLKDILQNQNENNNKRITRKSVVLLNNKIDDKANGKSDGETENETELSDNQCDDNEDEDNEDGNILDESANNNNSNENIIPREPQDVKEPDSVHNNQLTPMQEHRCPDCQRVFTYMANFRKHIKNICPVRRQLTDDKCNNNTSLTTNTPSNDASEQEDLNETEDIIEINEVKVPEDQEAELKDQDMKDEEVKEEFDDDELQKDESKLDLWRIKQEHPTYAFKGSPAQHHSCPYCQRGFTYLANYRKHIKSICPIRQQIEEKKKKVLREGNEVDDREAEGGDGASAGAGTGGIKVIKPEPIIPQVQYTPTSMSVRSQIEDTVLTMLRDQTKQHEIIKSTEINDEKNVQKNGNETPQKTEEKESQNQTTKGQSTFRFRTFSCSICHKIFLSYVTMLKHRLSHKLSDGSLGSNDDKNTKLLSLPSSPQLPSDDNQMKEVQNQELAVNLLKRSKTMIQNKLNAKLNLASSPSPSSSSPSTSSSSNLKIITTELLEKLARGGTGTGDSPTMSSATTSSAATCSATTTTKEHNKGNNLTDEIYLNDILTDSNQLIVDQLTEEVISDDKLNEEQLVLDSVDISNGNEVWITFTAQPNVITDSDDLNSGDLNSGAFVQVPCDDTVTYNNNSNNNNNNNNNNKCTTTTGSTDS